MFLRCINTHLLHLTWALSNSYPGRIPTNIYFLLFRKRYEMRSKTQLHGLFVKSYRLYPGITGVLISKIMLFEKCLLLPIIDGFFLLRNSDLELKPSGKLEVKLVQAKDLTNKDIIGKSDPFSVLFIRPLPAKTKTSRTIVSQYIEQPLEIIISSYPFP